MRALRQYVSLLLFLAAAGGYFYYTHPKPCGQPIIYRVGQFDTSFGLSRADFIDALNQAAQIWEKPVGLKLFAYDPQGEMPVNLIYDQRQLATQKNQALTNTIDQNRTVADSVKEQYSALQTQYKTDQAAYNTQLDAYNQALDQYNTTVEYWNGRGGAPKSEFEQLTAQKETLASSRSNLEQALSNLNALAAQVNALIDKYNLIADHINQNVSVVNSTAGREFNEGEFIEDASGKRINIYEFSDKAKLVRVLAHEMGHALGLEHNDDPNAIMYYLNQGTKEKLTAADLSELKAVCGIK